MIKLEANIQPWLKSYPLDVNWHEQIEPSRVYDMLAKTAQKYAGRPAMDFLGKKWKWRQIDNLAGRAAKGFQDVTGIQKGDRVGLFLPNSPYYLISYYALMRIGAIVVNLNPLYAERELERLVEDSGCKVLVTADLKLTLDKAMEACRNTGIEKLVICSFASALPLYKNILFRILKHKELGEYPAEKKFIKFSDLVKGPPEPAPVDIIPDRDIAVLQYTGGTTGIPKGAMLTHANITANTEQCNMWFTMAKDGEEKMLGVLPFFHAFAMTAIMNLSVRKGFEILAMPRFDLKDTLKLIHKKKPQYFPAVPAIYNAIINYPGTRKFDLSSLKFCVSGGETLPAEVKNKFEKIAGCMVVEGYGLSEASPVVCVNRAEGGKSGAIGLPLPGTSVKIIDTDTGKLLPAGYRGELCVNGPQVMAGYWNREEDTETVFKDGCLHTGDIAVFDDDGYVFVVGRIKDMIITGGYNVYPRNVEEAINLHPDVQECVVAGIPDKMRGEIVKAWVKPDDGRSMDEKSLRTFLKDKLSPMEIPRQIEFREKPLPRTMIGKLSRNKLLEEENKYIPESN